MKNNEVKTYKTIAYTFVMADLFHFGHLQLLKTAKKQADYHICGLLSDEACHLWQGINICNYDERKAVLESLDCVDELMKQETMDPTENLKMINNTYPEAKLIVIHGNDWKAMPGREFIESIEGKIIQPEYYSRLSRNTIINKFKQSVQNHPLNYEFFTHHFRVGNIAHFNSQPIHKLVSTKANTLKNFQSILKTCIIEDIFICTVQDFQDYSENIVASIQKQFHQKKIVVRSSSVNEDRYQTSRAGHYESVNQVHAENGQEIIKAFQTVIASYQKSSDFRNDDQILIQSQTEDIKKSGVVFTRNLQNNTPYYLINYDDETGKTDTVTGGEIGKSVWLYKKTTMSDYPPDWQTLLRTVTEIEAHLPGMVLDIEFAEKMDGTIVIFQIRPLAANVRYAEFDDEHFDAVLKKQTEKYQHAAKSNAYGSPFFSDMAFWNPAEIIGDNPHPLDYSLYREIITRKSWNTGLTCIGYSPVKCELMEQYGNKPYINLDHTFHSLIPEAIDACLRQKLIHYYRQRLQEDLTAHDKIEFEIVLSCYDFKSEQTLEELSAYGFSQKEIGQIKDALKEQTLSIITGYKQRLTQDLASLDHLSSATNNLLERTKNCTSPFTYLDSFLRLLRYTSRYGTPQFTTTAREAFIAKALCKSMVDMHLFSLSEVNNFLEGISSVASEFDWDFKQFACGNLGQEEFLKKYGHLRAGTYDITSLQYHQMDFLGLSQQQHTIDCNSFILNKPHAILDRDKLKSILQKSVFLDIPVDDFLFFLKSSIEQREYFKFEFTKSLSLAIELLAKAGEIMGFSRNDLAYLDLPKIKSFKFYATPQELSEFWKLSIETAKAVYTDRSKLILPPVLQDEHDFIFIDSWISRPNFITDKRIEGDVVNLDLQETKDLHGKIVMITKADPGFDWIFTQNITGLITKYGGAASHMAIRCAEFNLPAAIGCGEQIYQKISTWRKIQLDCKNHKILPQY